MNAICLNSTSQYYKISDVILFAVYRDKIIDAGRIVNNQKTKMYCEFN